MESGLVGLRAELQKKRAEASKFGASERRGAGQREGQRQSKKSFFSSNAGVSARATKDAEQIQEEKVTEEKARSILEQKAAMYDRLHGGVAALQDDDLNQKYLINFQKKIVSEILEKKERCEAEGREEQSEREQANQSNDMADEADEWVEYTDTFGRTRECMRKDLPDMLQKDKELKQDLNDEGESKIDGTGVDSEAMIEELHRDVQRQLWERQENVNATKKDLHYQDLLFDEARAHGPGFMRFSRDNKERQEQMEFLKEVGAETKAGKAARISSEAKRKVAMKARLDKVRQRKRLKMGLPVKDDDRLKTPPPSDDEGENGNVKEENVKPGLSTADDDTESQAKKPKKVREWDLGKEDMDFGLGRSSGSWTPGNLDINRTVNSSSNPQLSQEEWVNHQRSDRKQEFAPPTFYQSQQRHRYGPR